MTLARRPGYAGPLCPHGGEYRVTITRNRTLRVWCTCLSEYPDDEWVPVKIFHFDWLAEIDLTEDPGPIWRAHCAAVAGTEYHGSDKKWRKVTPLPGDNVLRETAG